MLVSKTTSKQSGIVALRNKTEVMRNTGTNRVAQKGDYSKCPLAESKFAKVLRKRIRLTDLI
jgi:hypothetical protein